MKITLTDRGGVCIATLEGRLDLEGSRELQNLCADLSSKSSVLDFSGVDYVSSAGLRALMQLSRASGNSRQPLAIAGRQPAVKRVFEMTGCEDLCPMFATLAEALKAETGL